MAAGIVVPSSLDKSKIFNFSWIKDGIIAGSSRPYYDEQLNFLEDEDIRVIINLTEEPHQNDDLNAFKLYNIPIPDFDVPKKEQITRFLEICNKHEQANEPILVHCIAGCGRTGTMLAIWLLSKQLVKSPEEAVTRIRELRPCSIETKEQEATIRDFSNL
ncbi:MAG: phosphatase domain-containing protein [Candidatus Kariarchaeaceae archaeon]|jgi:atypical dual specificity phosphatase